MTDLPAPRFLNAATPPTMATLVTTASLGAVSMNIILPSLPAIRAEFDTSLFLVQFLLSGYLFMNGVLQLLIGPISDLLGRRPVALFCFAAFTLASIACALAPNTTVLVAARIVQSIVVASFVISRAAVRDMSGPREAAAKLGYVAMGMSVAPMLAPSLGGALQQSFGWTAPFWALTVAGFMVFALCWRDFGETNTQLSTSFRAQVARYPDLLTSRRFWGYALATAFASGCFFAMLGGAPFVGVEVYGLSPAELGAWFIFTPAGYFIGNFLTGRLAERLGLLPMMVTGASVAILGMLLALALVEGGMTHPAAFFAPTICIGLGNGMVLPTASAGMMNIDPRLAGSAAGLGGALMTLGGAAMSAGVVPFLSVEAGATPLILFILASALLGLVATLYTLTIERQVAASPS